MNYDLWKMKYYSGCGPWDHPRNTFKRCCPLHTLKYDLHFLLYTVALLVAQIATLFVKAGFAQNFGNSGDILSILSVLYMK